MKQITAILVGLAFFVPSVVGAQSISTFELQELLQQDRQQLVALNGEEAVRAHIFNLLLLLSAQQGVTVGGGTAEQLYGNPTNGGFGNNSSDDVEVDTLSPDDIEDDSVQLRGEVEEGDDVRVWFAFSRTDSTPSCSTSSQRESVSGRYDEGDDFEEEITGLRDDTRYYYRACAEDEDDNIVSGDIERFTTDDDNRNNNDDEPDLETDSARDIEDDRAELRGTVDMNDFNNGLVFFVWGEDEDQVEDVEDEDEYDDVDEDGDDLQKKRVDSDLDNERDYETRVTGLDDDTKHYFTICVEYEDEDDDEVIDCGPVEEFRTDD